MKSNTEFNHIYSRNLTIYPKLGKVETKGKSIRLGPVNMRVLVLLVKNQGQVVTRNKIFDAVWANQVVSDDTLTRCISDLRTLLGKLSEEEKFIETIPKQGYQWMPEIEAKPKKTITKKGNKKEIIKTLLLVLVVFMVLSTAFLWIATHITPDKVRIALMPIQAVPESKELAIDIEDLLQANILENKKIGYLSASVLKNVNGNNFSYLSNEYGAQWIVEGKIRSSVNSQRIILSLVDARTALVVYSINTKVELNNENLERLCNDFIKNIVGYLDL